MYNISSFLFVLLIFSRSIFIIFLWVSIAILGLYIFILEGRAIITKWRIQRVMNRMRRKSEIEAPSSPMSGSYNKKKINQLRILWYLITLLSIVLTITY